MASLTKFYDTCEVSRKGQVATVRIIPPQSLAAGTSDLHWDLGEIFSDLRGDNALRIIVLTGTDDEFYVPAQAEFYDDPELRSYVTEPIEAWKTFTGILRCHQAMAEIEKPIVAQVNGHALGFGASLMLASDLVIAASDAIVADIHLGMGEVRLGGPAFGIVPGDGAGSLAPLFFTPCRAKEFLMLAREYTGKELAELGIINVAVDRDALDDAVEDYVARLLRRSAFALAWTKRVSNRHVVNQLNMTLDASVGYEMVNFLQLERTGGEDLKSLDK